MSMFVSHPSAPNNPSPKTTLLLAMLLTLNVSSPTVANTSAPLSPQAIYEAIERAQTEDPESYITSTDAWMLSKSADDSNDHALWVKDPSFEAGCTTHLSSGKVLGAAWLDGEVLDYTIDFDRLMVFAEHQGHQYTLAAKDLVGYQNPEGWPCAVPVAAVICAISGGAFCGWRITQCYKAAERCPCGVAVYNCGVCGEGSGVTCQSCEPINPPLPDLQPLFPWPVTWGDR